MHCEYCGAEIPKDKTSCERCGAVLKRVEPKQSTSHTSTLSTMVQDKTQTSKASSGKSRILACVFALFLGSYGVHKFYLGDNGKGILYLLFCWTYIPTIIGFVEGILYLLSTDEEFERKYVKQ